MNHYFSQRNKILVSPSIGDTMKTSGYKPSNAEYTKSYKDPSKIAEFTGV